MRRDFFALLDVVAVLALLSFSTFARSSGDALHTSQYKVLAPITQGNLIIFPVVTAATHDTSNFLTLDEGLRSGDVVITEAGRVQGLIRRPGVRPMQMYDSGAEVNRLVLVNHSSKPLLLLAGEIVTGGKQDRIIGRDRIVPVGAEPVDLSVFCVEPGRWTARSAEFKAGGAGGGVATLMVQPSVRGSAMATQNQQQVWSKVNEATAAAKPMAAATEAQSQDFQSATSYDRVVGSRGVPRQIDTVAAPIAQNYEQVIRDLRDRNAVGVVVALNGRIIWADIFASTDLLKKYWPKLARSYAAEAMFQGGSGSKADQFDAEKFLAQLDGTHEVVDSEPAVYRHTEITGSGFKAFQLTSLLPKTGFDVHLAKMSQ